MVISASSYEITLPDSRQIFVIVNAQPGERVDNLVIINPSPAQVAMIQCYEDIQSMLFDDGGPAYTTHLIELETNNGLVAGLISLDGSQVVDDETCAKITSNIRKYHESLRVDDLSQETTSQEHSVNLDVCAICLQEFEMGETYMALECKHGYHQECIEKWLHKKKNCPVCRAKVFPFLSRIFVFRVGS